MSDQENFLTRWSRRKRDVADAAEPPAAPEVGKPAAQGEQADQSAAARAPEANAPPAAEFDLTKLPSLDSIAANSDIRPFLQAGVPSALRHAALRRAWAADPAIRDFVGLAENAWDFTDPKAMPGFGGLDPQVDIKKLVAEIFGENGLDTKAPADSTKSAPAPEQPTQAPDKSNTTGGVAVTSEPPTIEQQQLAALKSDALLQRDANIATQQNEAKEEPAVPPARRHGSAMPQ
jgi:hypothetical protein